MKCIQLQSINEINQDFVFRMGQLHTIFYTLKVFGKIINGKWIWPKPHTIADIYHVYGTATVGQINSIPGGIGKTTYP